jgi:hypothetical protein
MLNKIVLLIFILVLGLGCGLMNRVQKAVTESNSNTITSPPSANTNKTFTDTAVDTAVGEKKIGIAECDEAMDILETQANNPDDNFVTKAVKKTMLNTFREQLKKSLEENKTDKKEVAKFCSEFRDNMEKSLKEENSNSGK